MRGEGGSPRDVKQSLHRMARFSGVAHKEEPLERQDKTNRSWKARPGDTRMDMLPVPSYPLSGCTPCRAVCSSSAAHVMRLLVTAVISPRRFVGDASYWQNGNGFAGRRVPPVSSCDKEPADLWDHIREPTCQAAAPNLGTGLSATAICDRAPADVGMMASRTDSSICAFALRSCCFFSSTVFEGCCMPTNRYLRRCTQALPIPNAVHTHRTRVLLALHLIVNNPLAGPLPTEISIAHLSAVRPFSILSC